MKIESVGQLMTAEVEAIKEAQVVRVQKGDILALVAEDYMSDDQVARIKAALDGLTPEGVRVVVIERMRFEVVRAEEQA